MKIAICVLLACIVATTYAQGLASLMMGGGALSSGSTGASSTSGASSAASALGRGGNMNQMLYFAALQGNEQARTMLTCTMMNMPMWLCLQRMA